MPRLGSPGGAVFRPICRFDRGPLVSGLPIHGRVESDASLLLEQMDPSSDVRRASQLRDPSTLRVLSDFEIEPCRYSDLVAVQ